MSLKYYFVVFFFVIAETGSLHSQNAKIFGNIVDDDFASIILSPSCSSKLIDEKTEISSKRGSFEFPIQIEGPSFYKLYYRDRILSIYIEPNQMVQVSINATKESNYFDFDGLLANENTSLNQTDLPSIAKREYKLTMKDLSKKGDISFFYRYIDSIVAIESSSMNNKAKEQVWSKGFENLYVRNNLEMQGLLYKSLYPRLAELSVDSFLFYDEHALSIYNKLEGLTGYENASLYYENVSNMIKVKVKKVLGLKIMDKTIDDLELYKSYLVEANLLSNQSLKENIVENLIGDWILNYGRSTDLNTEINNFVERLSDKRRKEAILSRLSNLAQYEKTRMAPQFSFEDESGNIRHINSTIGKSVYLYVYQSDAGYLQDFVDLSMQYQNQDKLQFISLSIDEDYEKWLRYIRSIKLSPDIHGISHPGGFNSDFAVKYGIQSHPRAILIDGSGNMINSRAPLPSQDKVHTAIKLILGQK
jgi:hypothetical protein